MLHWFFVPLIPHFQGFNLVRYISFRAAFAAMLSFLVVLVCGPGVVRWLRDRKLAGCTDHDSEFLAERRSGKQSVPTMGGLLIVLSVTVTTILLGRLDNLYVVLALLAFLAFGVLGAIDDWKKLGGPDRKGLTERRKLFGQAAIAAAVLFVLYVHADSERSPWRGASLEPSPYTQGASMAAVQDADEHSEFGPVRPTEVLHPAQDHRTDLQVPFFKHFCLDLGLFFLVLGALVMVGASNAVNLTDGLDGLATGCVAATAFTFALVAYIVGRADTSDYLFVFHIPGAAELTVFCAALLGASLGFLWFNGFPASVFMGDTGSLALGGALGFVAVATRHEITLFVAGGIFVAEALSVIAQRRYFRWTGGRRLLRCAPLHHHFEFNRMHEVKVTIRFWIVAILLALLALSLLKLR